MRQSYTSGLPIPVTQSRLWRSHQFVRSRERRWRLAFSRNGFSQTETITRLSLEGDGPAGMASGKGQAFEPADFCLARRAMPRQRYLWRVLALRAKVGFCVGVALLRLPSKQRPDSWTGVASAAVSSKKRPDSWTEVWFEALSSKKRPESWMEVASAAVSSKQRPDSWTEVGFCVG